MSDKLCRLPDSVEFSQWRPAAERAGDFAPCLRLPMLEQASRLAGQCLETIECTWCDVCQLLCPDLCITRDGSSGRILIDLDYCKGCGLCAHYCPKGAIEMVLEKGGRS